MKKRRAKQQEALCGIEPGTCAVLTAPHRSTRSASRHKRLEATVDRGQAHNTPPGSGRGSGPKTAPPGFPGQGRPGEGEGGRQGRRWGHRLGMNPGQQEAAALTPRGPHPSPSEGGGQPGCGLPNEDGEAALAVRRAAFPSAEVTFPNSTHYRADVLRGWDTY